MSVAAHPSSWSTRAQRDHAAVMGRGPWQTGEEALARGIKAAVTAVAEAMPHLAAEDILNPPHEWFDAALARQIVIHVLVQQFDIPKRCVVAVSLMTREAVNRGLRTIERRREAAAFDVALVRIQARAIHLHSRLSHG